MQGWSKCGASWDTLPSSGWFLLVSNSRHSNRKSVDCYIILLQAKPAFGFGLWDQVHANIRQPRLNSGPTVGAGHYSLQFFRQPHSLLLNRTNAANGSYRFNQLILRRIREKERDNSRKRETISPGNFLKLALKLQ